MDTLTFFAEIIKAVSWPVFIIVIILLLKKPISNLIPSLQRLRYKDFELEFRKQIYELAEKAETEIPESPELDMPHLRSDDRFLYLSRISPRSAILESWVNLETAAVDALRRRSISLPKGGYVSPGRIARSLQKTEIIDKKQLEIFNKLRQLRNMAAHSPDFYVSPDVVEEFSILANRLAKHIDKS